MPDHAAPADESSTAAAPAAGSARWDAPGGSHRPSLSQSERAISFVFAVLWLLVCFLMSPLLILFWLVQQFIAWLAPGVGARLLTTNEYSSLDLKVSAAKLHKLFRIDLIKYEVILGLKYLLDEPVRKCWVETLNIIILVSGLLTTSSYQARYAGFVTSVNGLDIGALAVLFRVANAISFLASITTIIVSAMVILSLNKYVSDSARGTVVFKPWSRALVYVGYQLAIRSFYVSLAAALAAVGFAGFAFFEHGTWADSIVVWATLLTCRVLIFVGALVTAADVDYATDDIESQGHQSVHSDPDFGLLEQPLAADSPNLEGMVVQSSGAAVLPAVQPAGDSHVRAERQVVLPAVQPEAAVAAAAGVSDERLTRSAGGSPRAMSQQQGSNTGQPTQAFAMAVDVASAQSFTGRVFGQSWDSPSVSHQIPTETNLVSRAQPQAAIGASEASPTISPDVRELTTRHSSGRVPSCAPPRGQPDWCH